MRFGSLFTSVIFHIAVIAFMTLGIAFTPEREVNVPPPITVEFAKIEEVTQTPEPMPKPPVKKPEEVKKPEPPKKKEEKPKPKAAPTNTSDKPVAPSEKPKEEEKPAPEQEAEVKPAPKLEPKKEEPKPKEPETNKKAAEKAPEPKKEDKPVEKAEPKKDFGSVLRNLADTKPEEEAEIADVEQENTAVGQQAPLGAQLTISELDALRRQLEGCWNVPIGARDIENMIIDVNIIVGPDRIVQQAGIVDKARYNSDSFFRAVADTAIRAVYSPSCSPLHLPEGKYETWKNIIVEFNPKEMF